MIDQLSKEIKYQFGKRFNRNFIEQSGIYLKMLAELIKSVKLVFFRNCTEWGLFSRCCKYKTNIYSCNQRIH